MKRSYRRVRKSYRRKKSPFKRPLRMTRLYRRKPDGSVTLKCHSDLSVLHNATGHADVTINWGGNGTAAGVGQTIGLPGINEFTHFSQDYNEYRITGVKIDFFPLQQLNAAGSIAYKWLWYGTDTKALPGSGTADNQIRSYSDFKMIPVRRFSRFIRVGKYYSKRNQTWRQTQTQVYDDVGTLIRIYSSGFVGGDTVGQIHCTWYVKFKGMQL